MEKLEFQGKKINNITGNKYGRLTALYPTKIVGKRTYWMFQCECGNKKELRTDKVISKKAPTKSCGCLKKENTTIHGMNKTRFYSIWYHIKRRCDNPNDVAYCHYGLRGISYCEEWKDFINFKNDMYDSYLKHCEEFGEENTTIDRIDVNSNYSKNNCRWLTIKEQANNRTNTIWVQLEDKKLSISDYCELNNLNYSTWSSKYYNSEYYLNQIKIIPESFFKDNTEVIK